MSEYVITKIEGEEIWTPSVEFIIQLDELILTRFPLIQSEKCFTIPDSGRLRILTLERSESNFMGSVSLDCSVLPRNKTCWLPLFTRENDLVTELPCKDLALVWIQVTPSKYLLKTVVEVTEPSGSEQLSTSFNELAEDTQFLLNEERVKNLELEAKATELIDQNSFLSKENKKLNNALEEQNRILLSLKQEKNSILIENDKISTIKEKLLAETEKFAREKDKILKDKEKFMKEKEKITQDKEKLSRQVENFSKERDRLAQEKEKAIQDKDRIAKEKDKIILELRKEVQKLKEENHLLSTQMKNTPEVYRETQKRTDKYLEELETTKKPIENKKREKPRPASARRSPKIVSPKPLKTATYKPTYIKRYSPEKLKNFNKIFEQRKPFEETDLDQVDVAVKKKLSELGRSGLMVKEEENIYSIGIVKVFVELKADELVCRVAGNTLTLEEYLDYYVDANSSFSRQSSRYEDLSISLISIQTDNSMV